MCIVVGFEFASCSAINSLGDLEHIASKLSHFTVLSPNEVPVFGEGSLNEISPGSWELTWLCAAGCSPGVAFHPPVTRCALLCYTGVKSGILLSSVRLLS